MGLGKTVQIIALIATAKAAAAAAKKVCRPTLVVCPVSVLSVWEEQLSTHVDTDGLTVHVYHGPTRTRDPSALARHDVVLTSYSTSKSVMALRAETRVMIVVRVPAVGADFAPEPLQFSDDPDDGVKALGLLERQAKARGALRTQPLQLIEWERVVCDEAHAIRNQRTQAAKACFSLVASSKWAVTGTPVQNKLEDLHALLKFIGVAPFSFKSFWTRFVARPIRTRSPVGLETV